MPGEAEIAANPRARSAVLRVAERTADPIPEQSQRKRLNGNEQIEFPSAACACVSAFSVVMQQNQYRLNFTALDKAKKQEIALEQDYAQMRLQQARLANHEAISTAAEKQNLHPLFSGNTSRVEHQR